MIRTGQHLRNPGPAISQARQGRGVDHRTGEVVELLHEKNRVRLETICVNQRGERVLSGEAWVLPPKRPTPAAGDGAGPQARPT